MKIPKCPKTLTGKHMFRFFPTEEWEEIDFDEKPIYEKKCIACGMYDDRYKTK
jgi:hypothetical protein